MAENIQKYIDKIWKMADESNLFVEQKVDFSFFINLPKQFGTSDAIILKNNEIQIHDLKYGFTKVNAKNNTQLQLYALGALKKFNKNKKIKYIKIFIHQPRLNYLSQWDTNIKDLFFFGKKVKLAAANASFALDILKYKGHVNYIPSNMYNPGIKQCKWCKASGGICKAEMQFHTNTINKLNKNFIKLDKYLKKKTNILNDVEISDFFLKMNSLNIFIKKINNRIVQELINGKKIPGIKLVRNFAGKRIWKNEVNVVNFLEKNFIEKKNIYKIKLVSPYQIEKILKKTSPKIWEQLNKFIIRSQGKIIAVANQDKRKKIKEII